MRDIIRTAASKRAAGSSSEEVLKKRDRPEVEEVEVDGGPDSYERVEEHPPDSQAM